MPDRGRGLETDPELGEDRGEIERESSARSEAEGVPTQETTDQRLAWINRHCSLYLYARNV